MIQIWYDLLFSTVYMTRLSDSAWICPTIPIPSMNGTFPNIFHQNQPNVGKHTIHGWYGYRSLSSPLCNTHCQPPSDLGLKINLWLNPAWIDVCGVTYSNGGYVDTLESYNCIRYLFMSKISWKAGMHQFCLWQCHFFNNMSQSHWQRLPTLMKLVHMHVLFYHCYVFLRVQRIAYLRPWWLQHQLPNKNHEPQIGRLDVSPTRRGRPVPTSRPSKKRTNRAMKSCGELGGVWQLWLFCLWVSTSNLVLPRSLIMEPDFLPIPQKKVVFQSSFFRGELLNPGGVWEFIWCQNMEDVLVTS